MTTAVLADGTQLEFPDGTSQDVISKVVKQHVAGNAQHQDIPPASKGMTLQDMQAASRGKDTGSLADLAGGLVRGAGSIGSTIVAPYDVAKDAIAGRPLLQSNNERRAGIDSGLQMMGADPNSGMYKAGKIGAEIAGTGGAGDVLAVGAGATKLSGMANALKSYGMAKDASLAKNITAGAIDAGTGQAMIDPSQTAKTAAIGGTIPLVGKAAPVMGGLVADLVGGIGTHTGGQSLKTAARVGMDGGQAAQLFADNMRGNVPMTDVLDAAKQNLAAMRQQKTEAYRSGMSDISKDKTILDFKPIAAALDNQASIGSYKGKVINQSTADTQDKLKSIINDWGNANPAEYHTPEGFDALKKAVGDISESTPFGTPSRKVADSVYNSIKSSINNQAPDYANTMKGYADASDQIAEIEKGLSLGNKASVDTAMRKLQSLTRNNVNTNYGNRLDLAEALKAQGGQDLMPALAGQALSSLTPRGIGSAVAGATGVGGLATMNALAIPALAMQSPRLMGEAALKAGKLANILKNGAGKVVPSTAALANALYSSDQQNNQ